MPALDAPIPQQEPRDAVAERHNARLGLILFAIYAVAYGSFVVTSAFAPAVLARPVGPLNGALVSGFGLIFGAMALSLVYLLLCKPSRTGATS